MAPRRPGGSSFLWHVLQGSRPALAHPWAEFFGATSRWAAWWWKCSLWNAELLEEYLALGSSFQRCYVRCYCMGPASHPVFYRGSRFTQQTLISAFLASIVADLMLKANFFDTNIAAQLAASHLHIETFHWIGCSLSWVCSRTSCGGSSHMFYQDFQPGPTQRMISRGKRWVYRWYKW